MADESESKLWRKMKQDPLVPIGIAACSGSILYGIYRYKTTARYSQSLSVFLMQMRVVAQGAIVGCMGIGMTYNLYKTLINYNKDSSVEPKQ